MKKSKLSITLVTSFIAAMAMTACSSVAAKKDTLVTFKPNGNKESISLLTDDVYNKYKDTNAGVSKFYEKILEALIRYEFKNKDFKGDQNYQEIENWAKNEVQAQKDKAKANAKSNGTSYDAEWKSILKSNDVENADELREKFIYNKEKEVYKDWYANNIDADLKKEFLGIDKNGVSTEKDVKSALPYHIRHILVKVDEASNAEEKFYKGTITEKQAKNLYLVASKLAEGKYTFSEIAKIDEISEDGSNATGGDVGIMTNNATSGSLQMVNEFQLGLYAYDNIYTDRTADAAASTIKAGLGITDEIVSKLPANVGVVPYEAFEKLNQYAEVEADKYGNKLANGSATLFPRNIIWNKYFNKHNVFLIKNAKVGANKFGDTHAADEFDNPINDVEHVPGLAGFNANHFLTAGKGNDNLVIGVRSEFGIHFMVIEKSMYEYATLDSYYDTKVPGQDGYDADADSYVNFVKGDTETAKKRADDVKSKITSFDSTYDYRLYKYLTGPEKYQNNISFEGAAENLDKSIANYISFLQEDNSNKQEEGLEKVWKTYYRMLEKQEYDRDRQFTTIDAQGNKQEDLTVLVSEKAADDFYALYTLEKDGHDLTQPAYEAELKDLYKEFAEGGIFYYYA